MAFVEVFAIIFVIFIQFSTARERAGNLLVVHGFLSCHNVIFIQIISQELPK